MNCSRIDGNRVKNRFADLFFAFTSIFDLLSHLRQQKRHPCGCLFCWLGLASIRTEPRTRRRCTFAARRSGSSLTRRRACESRSEAELPAMSPHNTKTVDRSEPPQCRGVHPTPAGDQWSPLHIQNLFTKP